VQAEQGDWSLMREHIGTVLANGIQENANYIINFAAWTVQNPGKPAEVALAFRGKRETGKGVFGRTMCELFGQHGFHASSTEELTGKHNEHLRDAVMLFADEAVWPGDKGAEGPLKRLITEPTLSIEPKFRARIQVPNRLHVIMASNEDWVVPAGPDERRYAVFDVSERHKQDENYFNALYQEINNGGRSAMLYDLQRMDLGDWHPRSNVPRTEALKNQMRLSLSATGEWLASLLEDGVLIGAFDQNPCVPSRTLFAQAKERRGLQYASDCALADAVKSIGACGIRTTFGRGWTFPPLAKARELWLRQHPEWSWETDLEEWVCIPEDSL
jgi:hypothetical protein